jgi:hypothetical protein
MISGAALLRNQTKKRANEFMTDEERILLKNRYKALQYDDYGDDSDSGGGSIAATIASSAASLGSAYLVSQSQPLQTQAPQYLRPPAATGTLTGGTGSSTMLFLGVIVLLVVAVFAFTSK